MDSLRGAHRGQGSGSCHTLSQYQVAYCHTPSQYHVAHRHTLSQYRAAYWTCAISAPRCVPCSV
eukprot:1980908-Rhodomonas_salina.2